jgi:hypothetical protein
MAMQVKDHGRPLSPGTSKNGKILGSPTIDRKRVSDDDDNDQEEE